MNQSELAFLPAIEQAKLIRTKVVSPLEMTNLNLQRIEAIDSSLGSYFTVLAEQARQDAQAKTEQLATAQSVDDLPPFFGVPISVKDLNPMKGVRFTIGSQALKDNVCDFDDAIVGKIKQAGFVILGKTATPEMGTMPFTESPGFPPARNPWNLDYTPGGSSGGAAAALAAGLCPISQASDGGGSVRGPASCCGLVGLKPSRGRISYAPIGDTPGGIGTSGPLAHTVADAAAFLDMASGYVIGDPYWLPDPEESFLDTAIRYGNSDTVRPLKIGFMTGVAPMGEADPVCKEAVLTTVKRLEALGHAVEATQLDCSELVEPFTAVFRACIGSAGIPVEAMSPINQWLVAHNDSTAAYFANLWKMQVIARQIVAHFSQYDAVVMPTYLHHTIRIGEWKDLSPEEMMEKVTRWVFPCPPFNATGQPSIALPVSLTDKNLPVGVQIVGRPADETTLIGIAAQLEARHPWGHRPAIATNLKEAEHVC
ncbi:MAG: amidase [Leptolyngbyaceae bacterium]|nr:amidase [Leptolyngbyaceae bacterium]